MFLENILKKDFGSSPHFEAQRMFVKVKYLQVQLKKEQSY